MKYRVLKKPEFKEITFFSSDLSLEFGLKESKLGSVDPMDTLAADRQDFSRIKKAGKLLDYFLAWLA